MTLPKTLKLTVTRVLASLFLTVTLGILKKEHAHAHAHDNKTYRIISITNTGNKNNQVLCPKISQTAYTLSLPMLSHNVQQIRLWVQSKIWPWIRQTLQNTSHALFSLNKKTICTAGAGSAVLYIYFTEKAANTHNHNTPYILKPISDVFYRDLLDQETNNERSLAWQRAIAAGLPGALPGSPMPNFHTHPWFAEWCMEWGQDGQHALATRIRTRYASAS